MLRNNSGAVFNFNIQTEALFKPAHHDPKTGKPLIRVSYVVDAEGNELPPFLVTCNTLMSMGEGARLALSIWADQGPETEAAP